MEDAMKPTLPLILSAIAFALLWSGWMVFLSHEPGTLAITAICALVAGYLWFRIMRWCFRLMRLLPNTAT
jgi:divalent metal cation (Fe/Co/Zn/Cd) transporter